MINRILCLVLALAPASSCTFFRVGSDVFDTVGESLEEAFDSEFSDTLDSQVQMADIVRQTGRFDEFECNIPAKVRYTRAEESSVHISVPVELERRVVVSNEEGRLVVSIAGRVKDKPGRNPEVWLSSPSLREVELNGAASFESVSPIEAPDFSMEVNGAASFDLDSLRAKKVDVCLNGAASGKISGLDAAELALSIAGAGKVTVKGHSGSADIDVAGVGVVDVRELECPDIDSSVSGVGQVLRK